VLQVLTREDLAQGFLIHESSTLSTIWCAQPCFNGLVTFDPMKPLESLDTVVPDLAEEWSWQDRYRNLVLFPRRPHPAGAAPPRLRAAPRARDTGGISAPPRSALEACGTPRDAITTLLADFDYSLSPLGGHSNCVCHPRARGA